MVELASVTVDLSGLVDPPLFEDPSFKFSVREGESGLTVGFIKVCRYNGFFAVFLSPIENYGVFSITIL